MQLRDYQQQTIDVLYDFLHYDRGGSPIGVLPTGAGKSICIAELIKKLLTKYPTLQFIVMSHVKEILEQNSEKVKAHLPDISTGIYCASLGKKELNRQITFASVQSLSRAIDDLKKINVVIVDEVHLVSNAPDSMYRKIFTKIKEVNPKARIIGFTATPFRAKDGLLTEGENRLFTHIPIDVPIVPLINKGYLSELTTKISKHQGDITKVGVRNGEYIMEEAEQAMSEDGLTDRILKNIIQNGKGRKRWLIFCCNVKHAHEVSDKMNQIFENAIYSKNITGRASCYTITGETPDQQRSDIISLYKDERHDDLKVITNCNVLTTGFDAPSIDLIAFMRPMKSLTLYIQSMGRGCRIKEGKKDCLVLDYAGNVERFGPLDLIDYRQMIKQQKSEKKGEPQAKRCPECESPVSTKLTICFSCGYNFPEPIDPENKLNEEASGATAIAFGDTFWFKIKETTYKKHHKTGKTPSLRVTYSNKLMEYKEWICFEHEGFPFQKALNWWCERTGQDAHECPQTVDEALLKSNQLTEPCEIKIQKDGKYWRIIDYNFDKGVDYANNDD
jgi:DNA repair protein RadD